MSIRPQSEQKETCEALIEKLLAFISARMSLYVMNIRHYPLVAARKG